MKKWIVPTTAILMMMFAAWAWVRAQTVTSVGYSTSGINLPMMVGGRVSGTNIMQDLQFNSSGELIQQNMFLQEQAATIVSIDTLMIGEQNFANPLIAQVNGVNTPSPYTITGSILWARIKVTGITSGYPWSVRFYGSRDGINYAPLMRSTIYWRTTGGTNVLAADDTLKITRRAPTGANGNWYPLCTDPALPLAAKQIIAVCSNDTAGTTTNGTTASFTVEIEQRN